MTSSPNTQVHIRRATNDDLEELSQMMARSYAHDPLNNWIGGAKHDISSANTKDPEELEALKHLRYFQWSLIRWLVVCGEIDLVILPVDGRDKIVACSIWVAPGKNSDPSPFFMLRMRIFRIWRAWGFMSLKRMLIDYLPQLDKAKEPVFLARGKKLKDAWYLGIAATDPDYENRGYASMMLKERFKSIGSTPIQLEASNPKARDIYTHYGFELVERVLFGVGRVDSNGRLADKEKATGWPSFIMVKWD